MLALKRKSLAALTVGVAVTLAGCSDYPGDGVIDTKELRKMAKIVEVEGNVYGIKTGGVNAYAVYEEDKNALRGAEYAAWEADVVKQFYSNPGRTDLDFVSSDSNITFITDCRF